MSKNLDREQKSEIVDRDTLNAIDEGVLAAQNGRRWTMEEAFEFARERRKEWAKKPVDTKSA